MGEAKVRMYPSTSLEKLKVWMLNAGTTWTIGT